MRTTEAGRRERRRRATPMKGSRPWSHVLTLLRQEQHQLRIRLRNVEQWLRNERRWTAALARWELDRKEKAVEKMREAGGGKECVMDD